MNQIPITLLLIAQIKEYLENGTVPRILSRTNHYKFKSRYGDGTWSVKDGELLHNNKVVVPRDGNVNEVLSQLFEDPLYKQTSVPRFHNRVSSKYEGISQSMIEKFLESQRTAQLFRKPVRTEVTPIKTLRPLDQIQIDYVDLEKSTHANLGNRYLLNVIDHFSKMAFSYPCKSRDSDEATMHMRKLFESGVVPSVLHADNEFISKSLKALCKEYGVKIVHSPPYLPRSNGCIERFNKTLKQAIREIQITYDDRTFIDVLNKLVENYNNTRHSAHKKTPFEVFHGNKEVIQEALKVSTKYRNEKIFKGSLQEPLKVGMHVRTALRSNSDVRKERQLNSKGSDVQFSEDIHVIKGIKKARQEGINDLYELEDTKTIVLSK